MKRDFLKDFGIADDVIDKIMAENGKDIEAAKSKAEPSEKVKSEMESLKRANKEYEKQLDT